MFVDAAIHVWSRRTTIWLQLTLYCRHAMLFLGRAFVLAALTDMNIYRARVLLSYVELNAIYVKILCGACLLIVC